MQSFDKLIHKRYNKKHGIYAIYCNNHIYIGSSINLYYRLKEHISYLKRNKHCNQFMQNVYNKHGYNNFKFKILKYLDYSQIINIRKFEKRYIDKIKPDLNSQLDPVDYVTSTKTKLKIKNTLILKYANKELPIRGEIKTYMYDINGKYIAKYNSRSECARINNLNVGKIGPCISGKLKTTGGFQFSNIYVPKMSKITSKNRQYTKYLLPQ
jgi:hypothetical protein